MNKKLQFFGNEAKLLHGGDYNPEQWLKTPEIIDEDFRLMKLANCNIFSVGIFSWTSYEAQDGVYSFDWLDKIMNRMAANGHKVLLATPSGAKPAWLARAYTEICRVDKNGRREPYQARHNHCWTSPVYRQKLAAISTKLAERYANHPALAGWHISNEYSGACYCESCQAKFREYLRGKYGSLENLNNAWYNAFWNHTVSSWEEITPWGGSEMNELDWVRFTTIQCVDFMKFEIDTVKKITPDVPAGTNFMGLFGGLDYWKLAEISDFIADDVYPPWDTEPDTVKISADIAMRYDFCRTMAKFNGNIPFFIMESSPSATNWQEIHRVKRPGQHRLQELSAIGHGADGTLYFQWRKSRGNLERLHGAVVDHVGHEHTRAFADVADLGKLYAKANGVCGSTYPAEVALIYDMESRWGLDCSSGPGRENKKYHETLFSFYQSLWENNVQMDVISSECDFGSYRILVVPMLVMLKTNVATRLTKFVENGGTLVMSYLSGYQDENACCFTGGWPGDGLMKLLGIWNEELNGLANFDSQSFIWNGKTVKVFDYQECIHAREAQVLATYEEDFCRGGAVITCNNYGKGKAYYIAGRTDKEFLKEFLFDIVEKVGVKLVTPTQSRGISITERHTANTQYLFIFNSTNSELEVYLPATKYISLDDDSICEKTLKLSAYGSLILRKLNN